MLNCGRIIEGKNGNQAIVFCCFLQSFLGDDLLLNCFRLGEKLDSSSNLFFISDDGDSNLNLLNGCYFCQNPLPRFTIALNETQMISIENIHQILLTLFGSFAPFLSEFHHGFKGGIIGVTPGNAFPPGLLWRGNGG